MLNFQKHPRDDDIYLLPDSHIYMIKNEETNEFEVCEFTQISKLASLFSDPFPAGMISINTAKKLKEDCDVYIQKIIRKQIPNGREGRKQFFGYNKIANFEDEVMDKYENFMIKNHNNKRLKLDENDEDCIQALENEFGGEINFLKLRRLPIHESNLENGKWVRIAWLKAAQDGTKLHDYIENSILKQKSNDPEHAIGSWKQVDDFLNAYKDVEWFRLEHRIYSKKLKLIGTYDAAIVTRKNEDGKVIGIKLIDWKNTHKLKPNPEDDADAKSYKKYYPPISHLKKTARNDYYIQLSSYAAVKELEYDVEIDEIVIVVFHETNDNWFEIKCPYLKKEVYDLADVLNNEGGPKKPVSTRRRKTQDA